MLFGSLFSSYALLRSGAPTWPDQSDGAERAAGDAEHGDPDHLVGDDGAGVGRCAAKARRACARYRLYMGLTLLGGALFLVVKAIEYSDKFSHGLLPVDEQLPRRCTSR